MYLVDSDVLTFLIFWSAGPQATNAIPPSDGSLPIGPDELATLVAAKICKPIRVRQQRHRQPFLVEPAALEDPSPAARARVAQFPRPLRRGHDHSAVTPL
jgi:hypothetical protein